MKVSLRPEAEEGGLTPLVLFAKCALFLGLVIISDAFLDLIAAGGALPESLAGTHQARGHLWLSLINYAWILATIGLFFSVTIRDGIPRESLFYVVLALVLLALASVAWSKVPGLTLRESVKLLLVLIFAHSISSALTCRQVGRVFTLFIFVVLVASAFAALLAPTYGIAVGAHAGAWQGVFTHKNHLGRFCALALVYIIFAPREVCPRILRYAIIVLGLLLLFLSKSSNGLMSFALAIIITGYVGWTFKLSPMARLTAFVWGAVGLSISLVAVFYILGQASSLESVKAALTGRVLIWQVGIEAFLDAPFVGHGLTAYWPISNIRLGMNELYVVPHAHNGYLDLAIDLGIVGLSTFLGLAWIVARVASTSVRRNQEQTARLILPVTVVVVSINLAESVLAKPTLYPFIVLVLCLGHLRIWSRPLRTTV